MRGGPAIKEAGVGRSGEIRTHDPQHPMLMRYQAALRSDRAALLALPIIVVSATSRNRWGEDAPTGT